MQVESEALEPRGGRSVTLQALETQTSLLPYALAAFALSLPIYVWAGSHAANAVWMTGSFAIFAIAWGVFYGAVGWIKSARGKVDLVRRGQLHLLCGLIWAAAVAQIAAFADSSGAVREVLMMISIGAAVLVIFFTAPWLASLLVVGFAAAAGPVFFLLRHPGDPTFTQLSLGALALALALALILNRILRRQFALAAEREILIAERASRMEEARRVAQSKSDLVATLSHEIRNGLTGVAHVLASAVGRNGRAAPSREQLAAALDAANDLIAVLNTTLDSETAEAGRLEVQTQPFDAIALARDLVLLNRPNAAAKNLELTLHVASDLSGGEVGAAIADTHRVRQILANLVSNALKFTVRGRVEMRIERASTSRIAIEVADTGPGLAAAELDKAFEPFNRIARTSAGTSGAGLGLSLSRQLARLMGGELSAHSAVGVGSCFRLELPFDETAQAEQETSAPIEVPTTVADAHRRLRVLIAEDDALNAAMLRSVIEQLGHQVVHAVDGRRAVDLARVCEFDLMMIDGRMPNLDGPAAIMQIRALPGAIAQVPVVAVIGGDADEAQECAAAGADAVLRKPVSVAAVARAVADAIAVDRSEQPARAIA